MFMNIIFDLSYTNNLAHSKALIISVKMILIQKMCWVRHNNNSANFRLPVK